MSYATAPDRVLDSVIALDIAVINGRCAMKRSTDSKVMTTLRIARAMLEVELPSLRLQGVATGAIEELIAEGTHLLNEADATAVT